MPHEHPAVLDAHSLILQTVVEAVPKAVQGPLPSTCWPMPDGDE